MLIEYKRYEISKTIILKDFIVKLNKLYYIYLQIKKKIK